MNALTRTTDPETSREAAASVKGLREKQVLVLDVFILYGQLSDELLIWNYRNWFLSTPQSESGLRSRRAELVRKGLLKDSGKRVKTASGRNSIVWELA